MDYSKIINLNSQKIEQLKKDALMKIKNSHYFDNFIAINKLSDEIIMNNASKFLSVLNSVENCKKCENVNKCLNRIPQTSLDLMFDEDMNEIEYIYHECDKKQYVSKIENAFIVRDFSRNIFSQKLVNTLNQKTRANLCMHLLNCIQNPDMMESCYVYGNMRLGKSYILSVFAIELALRDVKEIAFIDFPRFCSRMLDLIYSDKNAFYEELKSIIEAKVLIIDNFGNESRSDFIKDNIIYPIIFERFSKNLPTFYTSNYSLEEIEQMFATSKAAEPKARRMVDVIKTSTKKFLLEGLPNYTK